MHSLDLMMQKYFRRRGKVTAAIAKGVAESEFEKYRVIQDSLYESDFDRLMNDMENNVPNH